MLRLYIRHLQYKMRLSWNRHVSLGDLLTSRWATARAYGFGEGSNCYDSALIIGDVRVGKQTWIGPGTVLDGSGGLEIGDFCSIGAGAQIYSHDSVRWATSLGLEPYQRAKTKIGSGVYIGPNSVIYRGVTIGDKAVVGALSLVNRDIPAGATVAGSPARPIQSSRAEDESC